MDVRAAAALFAPEGAYLDTATVGLPPDVAVEAARRDLDRWRAGRLVPTEYDALIQRSRQAYARLVGGSADRVGIVSQVSVASAVAASALRPGDQVLLAEEDFTSVLFPFLQTQGAGVDVRVVPLDRLVDAIEPATTMVAVSAVQSADGRVLDLDALEGASRAHDVVTYVDLSQAASWLAIGADRFDITACGAYKWLCCPRGTGFISVAPSVADRLTPVAAGWYAGEDPWSSIYRPPVRLAGDGRRFDVSPAWAGWVAAAPTLELLADVGAGAIGAHDVGLANRLRAGIGLPPSDSAIVSLDMPGAVEALRAQDIACAGRDGRLRLAFHLYVNEDDVDRAIAVLRDLSTGARASADGSR
ncbi:MAG: aminotransferase class V-fold PLP-dependent enzyme [Actinobacteria bacterium]|nr:aminotransferase class V-fold PLP-dependent enzyme [Actinomycetota bacterium]